ncbi:pentapeptide repeat-containing protein [Nostoc sp.]|uniref:pentapeptide repeat-containing protein n=1 Tax=Nostoc sp. TaxID=1180 RepID=UPI003FA5437C
MDTNFKGANLSDADLSDTYFIGVKNLTPEQVKSAKNWDKAIYTEDFRAKLGLPPEPAK